LDSLIFLSIFALNFVMFLSSSSNVGNDFSGDWNLLNEGNFKPKLVL